MANILAVLDPDPERRRQTAAAARTRLSVMDGAVTRELSSSDLIVIWSTHADAPVSVSSEGDDAAVVLGEPLGSGGAVAGAEAMLRSWRGLATGTPDPHDGYFVAVGRVPGSGLVAEGDLLGLFPLYHARADGAVLVASSPSLIRLHPAFRPSLDVEGLIGILLTGGPVQGRTLWSGVQRLPPGHLLVSEGRTTRDVHQYTPAVSRALHALPFREQVEALDDALMNAVRRQARGRAAALLLSGGRDSRLVGGAMVRAGSPIRALTLGRRWDNEMYCAVRVARALDVPHYAADVPREAFPRLVRRWVRWEHLVGNISGLHSWRIPEVVREGGERLVASGHRLETATGAVHVSWTRTGEGLGGSREFLQNIAAHAIPAPRLRRLLRPALRDAVGEVWAEVLDGFEAGGDDELSRSQQFVYRGQGRFHAGAIPWRAAFGAWPLLPVLDRELLQVGGALPLATVGDRRAQDELLRTRYRPLARVPLDRHSGDRSPLLPSVPRQAWQKAAHHLPVLRRLSAERRIVSYAWRVYDPDGPGWREVRRIAEPSREAILDLFEPDALCRFVPPPDVDLDLGDPVADGFGPRSLIGLMLWAGEHRA